MPLLIFDIDIDIISHYAIIDFHLAIDAILLLVSTLLMLIDAITLTPHYAIIDTLLPLLAPLLMPPYIISLFSPLFR
jgi:hypothetical protein